MLHLALLQQTILILAEKRAVFNSFRCVIVYRIVGKLVEGPVKDTGRIGSGHRTSKRGSNANRVVLFHC